MQRGDKFDEPFHHAENGKTVKFGRDCFKEMNACMEYNSSQKIVKFPGQINLPLV